MQSVAEAPASGENWWTRPAGGREVWGVAAPLVVSTLSWTVMTFIDRMFLSHVSGETMSAAFTGGVVWFAMLSAALGICTYANTFVAQYHGRGLPGRIGPSTWASVWVAAMFTVPALAMPLLAEPIFSRADHGSSLTANEISYFTILCWGGPALLLSHAVACFYSGRGRTDIVMCVDASFAMLNLVLDYLWIFGHLGFPAMGIEGAAWATVCSLWLKAVTYGLMFFWPGNREHFQTLDFRAGWGLVPRLLKFGVPGGLQMLLDISGFSIFILLVGRLGQLEAVATNMAFSISSLAFMPAWGLAMAGGILVGQHLGEDRDHLAARSIWTTLTFTVGYMGIVSALYVLLPSLFLYGFFKEDAATEAERQVIWDTGVVLLRFVATYNVLDAAGMVFINALKGAGDTRYIFKVTMVLATLMATATWVSIEVFHMGIYTCWTIIALWVWVQGSIFALRFLGGKWRSMRVIETDAPHPAGGQAGITEATSAARIPQPAYLAPSTTDVE